ncbi:aminotransferase class V-fold PLP-dependent enzyme [Cohaesibacter intestini]|uniref:aminotransferase class V-fold PLP-dependent enzyme n=1 Tax=Cohaesibacter intestini TaxID=2211145 RepID=UPI000DEBBF79|nr:aminotransferase class V-fold PLP-dependent enzyme [Cohaesibacter intestini]
MTKKPINARGTFTPLGVSRSSERVSRAVGESLRHYAVMEDLKHQADLALKAWSGAEAGTLVHCTAAAITLSVAACMTGTDKALVRCLPLPTGGPSKVVLPAGHNVNYGHPVRQAIRLSGATPLMVGEADACSEGDLASALKAPDICALLLVHSRLVRGVTPSLAAMISLAKDQNVPVILDGAAQDFKVAELVALDPDLLLLSGQKYLASPTAGIVVGKAEMVAAVAAQESGIGRGMKASKEAITGVLAAIEERQALDLANWAQDKAAKLAAFLERANLLPGVTAYAVADPTNLPFERACLRLPCEAAPIIAALKASNPAIWVMEDRASQGEILLESVMLSVAEEDLILQRLAVLLRDC